MGKTIGVREWVIAEGYIPPQSHGPQPQMLSHETVCLLNTSDDDAHVEITIYYSDREPVGPYKVTVPRGARGTCASTTSAIPSPFPKTRTFPASFALMSLSWPSIPGSTRARRRTPCWAQWPIPARPDVFRLLQLIERPQNRAKESV